MSLSIIKPGLLDTIQDLGRYGYGSWGINPGGVMDAYAARVANMLVGNEPGEAVMEIHFPGAQLLFEQNALISITGADFSPTLNDNESVGTWRPIVVRRNTLLHFPGGYRAAVVTWPYMVVSVCRAGSTVIVPTSGREPAATRAASWKKAMNCPLKKTAFILPACSKKHANTNHSTGG